MKHCFREEKKKRKKEKRFYKKLTELDTEISVIVNLSICYLVLFCRLSARKKKKKGWGGGRVAGGEPITPEETHSDCSWPRSEMESKVKTFSCVPNLGKIRQSERR